MTRVLPCLIVLSAVVGTPLVAAEGKKPNILFILTDDQRWDTIHALGNPEIQTPVLDSLVDRGFHFTNAYCQGSMIGAVCLPSRTMILTGRSLWHLPEKLRALEAPAGVPLLPTLVKEAGYATFHTGKPGNACRYANSQFETNIESGKNRDSAVEHTNNVLEFLKKHDGARPFFVFLAPPVPHDPRWSSEEYQKLYPTEKISLSANYLPQHPFDNGELEIRDEVLAPFPRTPEVMRQHLADYYASVSQFDHEVGHIFTALKDRGWWDNTVVVFASDQGLAVGGRHGLMGKQNLYEHVKPPLILAGPGIPHGKSDALTYLYDLFPTICDLAETKTPQVTEGGSLLLIIRGEKPRHRDVLFGAYRECQRMVRDDRWKLISYNASGVRNTQLFDLSQDPDELRNLAEDPSHADQRQRLEKLLDQQRAYFGDPINFRGDANPASVQSAR